jgi:TIGR03009 family protein
MRSYGLTLVALLVLAPIATTQTPRPSQSPIIGVPGTGMPNQDAVDRHLKNWETRMKGVESILAKLERIETAKDGTIRKLTGEARYLKPNYAALRMIRTDNPNLFEMYVCSGPFFYEYRAQTKEIWVRRLQAEEVKGQSNFLSLLVGMTAVEVKQQFNVTLTRQDADRIYFSIEPRAGAKLKDFEKAELVLLAKSMLPDRVWFRQVNGSTVEWRVTSMDLTQLKPVDFTPPNPAGWKWVTVPGTSASSPGTPPR